VKKAVSLGMFVLLLPAAFFLGRRDLRKMPVESASSAAPSPRVLYYLDPMHPSYKSDKPGIAPDCGMELVPVYADLAHSSKDGHPAGTVRISAEQQHMIGLRTATVVRTTISDKLRILGMVTADDARVYSIKSGVAGWLRQTMDNSIGSHVRKDQTLATFYSSEFLALEQGYLVATERMAGVVSQQAVLNTQAAAARLRNYGMGDKQIAEIAATRQLPENVDITSPENAFITFRNASSGQRFEKGVELYRLADLSRVWIVAEVIEGEAQYFHPGMKATVSLPGQSRTLQARVSNVLPQSDPTSLTIKVRLEADNPGYLLRPNMFVNLELPVRVPAGLSVTLDSLIDSGTEQRVYVDAGDESFEPRAIIIGRRFGDRVEILDGLEAGEKVVQAETFLVDSESRLKSVRLTQHALFGREPPRSRSMPPLLVRTRHRAEF
jgi:Cu(I)/Ag(I) efflux system membrane fusion protein